MVDISAKCWCQNKFSVGNVSRRAFRRTHRSVLAPSWLSSDRGWKTAPVGVQHTSSYTASCRASADAIRVVCAVRLGPGTQKWPTVDTVLVTASIRKASNPEYSYSIILRCRRSFNERIGLDDASSPGRRASSGINSALSALSARCLSLSLSLSTE